MAEGERILYPSYFNAGLTRAEGRRIRKSSAIKAPAVTDIERALRRAGIPCRVEDKHHPGQWSRHEGRIIAVWKGGKEALIRAVGQKLQVRK